MELDEILARDNAHIRSKEAEALAMLKEFTAPARQQLDAALRDPVWRQFPPQLLTAFVDPNNHAAARQTIKVCTALLFDVYAETVSKYVIDAEPFISLLPPIAERVRLTLETIDKDEAEVRRHKWESAAWAWEKPTLRRRLFKWLMALLSEPAAKATAGPAGSKVQAVADNAGAISGAAAGGGAPAAPTTVGNGAGTTLIEVSKQAGSGPREPAGSFKNRASWLEGRLLERGWSTSAPSQWGGPDRKTIDSILRGKPVGNAVLQKLAVALSQQVHKVNVLDIPKN